MLRVRDDIWAELKAMAKSTMGWSLRDVIEDSLSDHLEALNARDVVLAARRPGAKPDVKPAGQAFPARDGSLKRGAPDGPRDEHVRGVAPTWAVTVDGGPLPANNSYRNYSIFAVSDDTGVWHEVVEIDYDSAGGYALADAQWMLPGTYDIVFSSTSGTTPGTHLAVDTWADNAYPHAVQVLDSCVVVP